MCPDQIPGPTVHLDDVNRLQGVAILAKRDRAFERRVIRHGPQRIADGGSLRGEFGRIARHFRLLHRIGIELDDVVGCGLELRNARALDPGGLRPLDHLRLEGLGFGADA